MAIHLKVLDSTDSTSIGQIHEAFAGLIIGRAKGHIIIEDERISSTHAEIQMNNQGEMFLVDKDSRNGIKVQGKRITKLLMTPGTVFQIGNTLIEVIFGQTPTKTDSNESSLNKLTLEANKLIESVQDPKFDDVKVVFFHTPLKLSVIQGLQLDQIWNLEYGPYRFGSGCVGGLLVGKNFPVEIFEITSVNSKVMIRSLTQSKILYLNSISVTHESIIESGDILSIKTEDLLRIKIEF